LEVAVICSAAIPTEQFGKLYETDDGGAKVTVSAFGKEVEATVSLGDLVGTSWVYFLDPLNKSYKISNSFEFTIDQEM
jgi:hypothetical protein